jgi:hypothetical protein
MYPESGKYMPDPGICKVEAEECDAYEEGNEPVAMIEESPPDIEPDG